MIYAIIGLVFGIIGGILTPGFVPKVYAPYFSVALMAGLDTAFGGLRAAMEGDYDNVVFLSGFLVNIMLSVIMMDIDFYMVVILVLGMRIFNNLAIIRRLYLKK